LFLYEAKYSVKFPFRSLVGRGGHPKPATERGATALRARGGEDKLAVLGSPGIRQLESLRLVVGEADVAGGLGMTQRQ
jgi:hypothetical protein